MEKQNLQNLQNNNWKNKNTQYLFEIQKLMDIIDNVENENLRREIIGQVLRCDKYLTDLAENVMSELIKNNI